ncbi:zinc finger protein 679-like [Microplitis mediator]|uniref:zinc finger protein 679-like n=1 Tax=Microplitis mediator TaxID=375433 RepID=UPI002554D91E|nr:zinc finger protein 679-like [Microplitis mediator]XP_057320806.1 zinc finger protein 679-like [Microplitis mediator]
MNEIQAQKNGINEFIMNNNSIRNNNFCKAKSVDDKVIGYNDNGIKKPNINNSIQMCDNKMTNSNNDILTNKNKIINNSLDDDQRRVLLNTTVDPAHQVNYILPPNEVPVFSLNNNNPFQNQLAQGFMIPINPFEQNIMPSNPMIPNLKPSLYFLTNDSKLIPYYGFVTGINDSNNATITSDQVPQSKENNNNVNLLEVNDKIDGIDSTNATYSKDDEIGPELATKTSVTFETVADDMPIDLTMKPNTEENLTYEVPFDYETYDMQPIDLTIDMQPLDLKIKLKTSPVLDTKQTEQNSLPVKDKTVPETYSDFSIPHSSLTKKSKKNKTRKVKKYLKFFDESKGLYICKECNYSTIYVSVFKKHVKIHMRERRFSCPHCSVVNYSKYNLMMHIRTHTNEKPYECDICSMKYSQAITLKEHKLRHEKSLSTSDEILQCSVCQKIFPDREYLRVHKKEHKKGKFYKCAICLFTTKWLVSFKNHAEVHKKRGFYVCNECGRSLKHKKSLRTHLVQFHSLQFRRKSTRVPLSKKLKDSCLINQS